ncbi:hypothetical protein NTG1052_570046 [Candidatus Nitrotoga sp. 1052]|nr:hypothetical protein NTG1052_570046 [Candidatus Nitrotoga sp. 1052]
MSIIHHQSRVKLHELYIGFSKALLSHITNQALKLQPCTNDRNGWGVHIRVFES